MENFLFELMGIIIVGVGSVVEVVQYVCVYGVWVFVVSDFGVCFVGVLDNVIKVLIGDEVEFIMFIDVDLNLIDVNVVGGVVLFWEFGIDGIVMVFVGGGLVMDCGKYIVMVVLFGVDDFLLVFFLNLDDGDWIDFIMIVLVVQVSVFCLFMIVVLMIVGIVLEINGGGLIM